MERVTRQHRAGPTAHMDQVNENDVPNQRISGVKRAVDPNAPTKPTLKKTRKAFGDITNNTKGTSSIPGGKKEAGKACKPTATKKKTVEKKTVLIPHTATGSLTNSQQDRADTNWVEVELSQPSSQVSNSSVSSQGSDSGKPLEDSVQDLAIADEAVAEEAIVEQEEISHEDIDKDETDIYMVPTYAYKIFEYAKIRERAMRVRDYIAGQRDLTTSMRSILVDWLVEVQENFELNHETLYLAVKIVDKYLCEKQITRENLQLLGSTAMFIACKFDERMPPVLDDFIYICDDAYTRDQILDMERKVLKTIGFDLGFPLSYSFLRRFSKCGRSPLETLTLARYILETSLMEYSFVNEHDSLMAAAALYLALSIRDPARNTNWTVTLEYYTSYSEQVLLPMVKRLNQMISEAPTRQASTIRTKYSHEVFHKVALLKPLTSQEIDRLSC